MTIEIISYLRNCEYGRAIMSYLILGNHWEPRKSVRLTDLEKKVKLIRGHVNRSMLYRTLKDLEKMKVIKVYKTTGRGHRISESSPKSRSCYTAIHLEVENFREALTDWCITLGYESFREFLQRNGYPHAFNAIRCCRIMKDGYTYIQDARLKNTNLVSFVNR